MAAEPAAGTAAEPTVVYTDGACLGNPGPGGWAWAVPGGARACGAEPDTTNNRMELQAVLEALRELDGRVEVVSDSTYVVKCFRDRWYEGWRRRDWRTSKKKLVANRDLWEPLIGLYESRPGEISFRWVKGHSGDEWNELVDQLAVGAATDQISRGVPAEPLPGLAADSAAEPAAGTAAEPTIVYTDGACLGNPGPGGWAWAVPGGEWACGAEPHTTNNRMELQAVLEALRELDGPVAVMSDSTYVVNCFRDRWYEGWLRRNWRNANKKPVANRDLWEPLIQLYLDRGEEISFRWVKGHYGDEWNEVVDQLAVGAATDQRSRRSR